MPKGILMCFLMCDGWNITSLPRLWLSPSFSHVFLGFHRLLKPYKVFWHSIFIPYSLTSRSCDREIVHCFPVFCIHLQFFSTFSSSVYCIFYVLVFRSLTTFLYFPIPVPLPLLCLQEYLWGDSSLASHPSSSSTPSLVVWIRSTYRFLDFSIHLQFLVFFLIFIVYRNHTWPLLSRFTSLTPSLPGCLDKDHTLIFSWILLFHIFFLCFPYYLSCTRIILELLLSLSILHSSWLTEKDFISFPRLLYPLSISRVFLILYLLQES